MTDFFLHFNLQEIAGTFMILFSIIGVISNIPIIIALKKRYGSRLSPVKSTGFALSMMLSFLFFGEKILSVIGIDVQSFAVAGSFILFVVAIEMVLDIQLAGKTEKNMDRLSQDHQDDPSIVPLAFPLIAGAGSMTTVLSLRAEYEAINIAISILLNMCLVYFTLIATQKIEKFLGSGGIAVLRKLFGVVLLSIAIKLFTSNIKYLFR